MSVACCEVNVLDAVLNAVARFCPAVRTAWRDAELVGLVARLERLENSADISVPISVVEVVNVGWICCNEANDAFAPLWAEVCD